MSEFKKIEIEKFLNWYKNLSNDIHLKVDNEQTRFYVFANDTYFIPTVFEWNFFDEYRKKGLEQKKNEFTENQLKSIVSEKKAAYFELENYLDDAIIENPFYGIAQAGTPIILNANKSDFYRIPKTIIVEMPSNPITLEIDRKDSNFLFCYFIQWIANVDYYNWLLQFIDSETTNKTHSIPIEKQVMTIALYYYYLEKGGEESLYNNTAFLKKVAIENGNSSKTLQDAWNRISQDKNERTAFVRNNLSDKQRIARFGAVRNMLKKFGNSYSIIEAEKEYKEIILKKNKWIENNK